MLRFALQLTAVLNKGLEIFKAIFLTFYNNEPSSTRTTDCPTMLVDFCEWARSVPRAYMSSWHKNGVWRGWGVGKPGKIYRIDGGERKNLGKFIK